MWIILSLILLGIFVGAISGLVGIGGGIILVPSLVLLFGITQKTAQGTTLALLLPPIGIFAVWEYYKQGYVDLRIAILLAVGFIIGSFIGAKITTSLPSLLVERVFGFFLLLIALKMLFLK